MTIPRVEEVALLPYINVDTLVVELTRILNGFVRTVNELVDGLEVGVTTITDPAVVTTVTFPGGHVEPDTNYDIVLTFEGAVPTMPATLWYDNKTTTGFDVHLDPAQGGGAAVNIIWHRMRL